MEGFKLWNAIGKSVAGKLSVHNCATYDQPIIHKVMDAYLDTVRKKTGKDLPAYRIPDEKFDDTFIRSKIQWQGRPTPKGAPSGHGLKAYGILNGIKKPDISDWTTMDPYKLHRVIEDVKIQKFCTQYLDRELFLFTKNGINLDEAYSREYEYAQTCHRQEVYGTLADVPHMERCIEIWDTRLEELERIIEPQLPPTVKPSSSIKITRKEMAKLLGYPDKLVERIPVPQIEKVVNGEKVLVDYKPYCKPTTNWTLKKKGNVYQGFELGCGMSPPFGKRKELTDWIKTNHPDTKTKDWEITKTETIKEHLNANTCKFFELEPDDTDIIVGPHTKVKFEDSTLTQHEIVKGFLIKSGIKEVREWNLKKDAITKQPVRAEKATEVRYPPKAAPENQLVLKIAKGEALVTSPKIGEKEYEQLETETGKQIGEYNTTIHRRRFILNPNDPEEKGLLANVRPDGRIPCGVNNFMTETGRSSHRIWVNAPGAGALYGEEMRRCLIAPAGRKLVSSDMNSAQLSIAAYYANNVDYFKAVCFGNEFKVDEDGVEVEHPDTGKPWYLGESGHCTNMQAFGLVEPTEVEKAIITQDQDLIHSIGLRRKKSKGATFGVIFGCSGKKLALMLGIDENEGNKRKNKFLGDIGLDRPIAILEEMTTKYKRGKGGYIELPFGYYVHCSSPHARFNYLDQGTEAACQKWAEIYFDRKVRELGLDAQRVLSYHDEFTVECAEDITEVIGKLMNEAYFEASVEMWEWHRKNSLFFKGEDFPDFHIQLNAGYKVGDNYWDIH
ncbi:DNA polymerase [Vibrio phage RYC]|nr:DNA polymerase [Vibrio phage RYC]